LGVRLLRRRRRPPARRARRRRAGDRARPVRIAEGSRVVPARRDGLIALGRGVFCRCCVEGNTAEQLAIRRTRSQGAAAAGRCDPAEMTKRVLLVDADTTLQAALVQFVSGLGHDPVVAFDGAEAVAHLSAGGFDLCVTDLRLPGAGHGAQAAARPSAPDASGFAVLQAAAQCEPAVPVVMLGSEATVTDAIGALRAGAVNFLP